MKVISVALSLFLANNLVAGTWKTNIGTHSIRYTTSDKSVEHPTILIVQTEDGLRITLQGRDGHETVLSGAMGKLVDVCNRVRKLEPRMQNFVGLVKRHLGSLASED